MEVFAGSSGFAYKPWKGPFYPKDLPDAQMLGYYADHLPTVEINNTFYRLPKASVVAGWGEQVPDNFRFTLKASRRITHFSRLKNAEEPTGVFTDSASELGPKLGVLLFQLPPNMKADSERLEGFLDHLPKGGKIAMEFRHETWFTDEIYDILRARNAALVVTDTDVEEKCTPMLATADWGYLRLRRPGYSDDMLKSWVDKIGGQAWDQAYVYFKHEDAGAAPKMAQRLIELSS